MSNNMPKIKLPDPLPNGVIPASYIGVNGEQYRVRVPVRSIVLEQLEGETSWHSSKGHSQLPVQTFDTFHSANWQLLRRRSSVPEGGGYFKHRFTVTWANGFEYTGRFDLENNDAFPSIDGHIRRTLNWMIEQDLSYITADQREQAAFMLEFLSIGQTHPTPAPKDWPVVRNYKEIKISIDEKPIERIVYAMDETESEAT